MPHVLADDFPSLGFGIGYAFAEDNLCTLMDYTVTVRGERSRWFGPEGTWEFGGNGTVNNNLDSDFFYASVNQSGVLERLLAQPAPHGPLPEIQDSVTGLRRRHQPVPGRHRRRRRRHRPPLPGRRVGAAPHRDRRLPPRSSSWRRWRRRACAITGIARPSRRSAAWSR